MKLNHILTAGILAAAAALLGATPARAGNVVVNPQNDLILGIFGSQVGTGTPTDLEIDLGQASLFTAGNNITLSGLTITDLVGTFGASWYTSGSLTWGIVGTSNNVGVGINVHNTIYGTLAAATPGASLPGFTTGTGGGQSSAVTAIKTLYAGLGALSSTANSASAAAVAAANNQTYTTEEGTTPGQTFGFFDPTVDGNLGISDLDLYQLNSSSSPTAATELGTVSITSNGVATFSAAVPEPTSFAMLGLGALLLGTIRLRRSALQA